MAHACPKILCESCIRNRGFNVAEYGHVYARCELHAGDVCEWIVPKHVCEYYEEA